MHSQRGVGAVMANWDAIPPDPELACLLPGCVSSHTSLNLSGPWLPQSLKTEMLVPIISQASSAFEMLDSLI